MATSAKPTLALSLSLSFLNTSPSNVDNLDFPLLTFSDAFLRFSNALFTSSCFAFALDNTKIAALSAALYSFLTASSASLKLSCDVRSPFFST